MIYIWHKENKNRTVYSRTLNIYSEENTEPDSVTFSHMNLEFY